jgi:hypothetical protein
MFTYVIVMYICVTVDDIIQSLKRCELSTVAATVHESY